MSEPDVAHATPLPESDPQSSPHNPDASTSHDKDPSPIDLEDRVRQQELELARLRRRDRIHEAVGRTSVVDAGAACLLIERALDDDSDASLDDVMRRLREERPWLFASAGHQPMHAAAAPRSTVPTHSSLERAARSIDEAATRARTTGHTSDLLTYLRLKDARERDAR